GLINHMHGVENYHEALGRLQASWVTLTCLINCPAAHPARTGCCGGKAGSDRIQGVSAYLVRPGCFRGFRSAANSFSRPNQFGAQNWIQIAGPVTKESSTRRDTAIEPN